MNLYWPIFLIVFSNIFYHLSTKQTPKALDPLASVTITYLVAALFSGVLYFCINKNPNILKEYSKLNWTSFILGLAVVGLEIGSIYMYKVGWNMNTGYMLHSGLLSIALLILGFFLYGEQITLTKVFGILICLFGLWLLKK